MLLWGSLSMGAFFSFSFFLFCFHFAFFFFFLALSFFPFFFHFYLLLFYKKSKRWTTHLTQVPMGPCVYEWVLVLCKRADGPSWTIFLSFTLCSARQILGANWNGWNTWAFHRAQGQGSQSAKIELNNSLIYWKVNTT